MKRLKNVGISVWIQVLVWTIVLLMPLFFRGIRYSDLTYESYIRFLVVPLSFMFLFYLNYFYLTEKLLNPGKTGLFICLNLLIIVSVVASVHLLFRYVLVDPMDMRRPFSPTFMHQFRFFSGNAVIYSLVVAAAVAVRMTENWYRSERQRQELEKDRVETELAGLKSQLNPHFLFNTLNSIYSLIMIDQEKAQNTVHDLSRLLRYVLYRSNGKDVLLSEDLAFVSDYMRLMQVRLKPGVDVSADIPADCGDRRIAPLLFISLVENAYKHGLAVEKPFIHVRVSIEGNRIVFDIENSCGHDCGSVSSSRGECSGIGIANLERRLEILYPGRHRLECGRENGTYRSVLEIEL